MKKITIILAIIGFIYNPYLFAQLEVKVSRHEFKVKQSGFREAWFHVKEGDNLVKKVRELYQLH
ncbi:MAG: hypothetical protein HC905_24960 [Bacteroidales bacterium]|nr:hypothetical protein [Bacteroidales bacterium]